MSYTKINEYATTIYNVFKMVNTKGKENNNNKLGYISIMIYNYYLSLVKTNRLDVESIEKNSQNGPVNLLPIFEYINHYEIELYDFKNIDANDVNTKSQTDIERFVLSHIYYLTQNNLK